MGDAVTLTVAERSRRYYERHREERIEQARRYRESHPESTRAASRRWNDEHRDHRRQYRVAYDLIRMYGITPEEYERLGEQQDWRCAICQEVETAKHQSGSIKRLAVDHDDETGRVRALLCQNHNTMLGLARHDPAVLASAITYLDSHR